MQLLLNNAAILFAAPDARPVNEPTLPLNSTYVRNRIAELGLRQWWLAEQIGVDRRTVMRWVNGQVRSLLPAHAERLAQVLGCPLAELRRRDDGDELASPDDQRAAGQALAATRLLDRLGPVHEWDVAERLIKAIALPDLPLAVLGALYLQLAEACWRQDKLAEATQHDAAALAIAARIGDHALHARSLGLRASLRFLQGQVREARADWQAALARAGALEPRDRGSLHNNLGASLHETGRLDEGEAALRTALGWLQEGGTPMQLSIAHVHLALIALERGDADVAAREALRSEALARRDGYRRGLAFGALLRADIAALRGDEATAREGTAQGLAAFEALGIREAPNHRLAGRAMRRLGQLDEAGALLRSGLPLAAGFPLERADLLAELARVDATAGRAADATAWAAQADATYRAHDADARANALQRDLAARRVT